MRGGDRAGRFSRREQSNADWQRVYANKDIVLDSLAHGHQPRRVDGRPSRGEGL
jgi:hypothetical protein